MQPLSYGPHRQHVMDLHLPSGAGPHPVAFVLHGGFWRARYKRNLMAELCVDLARRGWAAVNVEYRRVGWLTGGGGGVPETLEDVQAALDHLATVDAALDLSRVVSIGHSAGGHLALWAAAPRAGARVRCAAAIGQGAVSDLHRAAALRLGNGIVERFCGGTPEQVPQAYAQASPAALLPFGVPQLLVHGGRDDIVPASLSADYVTAANQAGDDARLLLRPDDGHFEFIDPASNAWKDVAAWLTRFDS